MSDITDYNKIIYEYFDFKDRDTRRTLISLDEADQNQLLAALTSKLYDKIVEKVDDIDFGTIPRSRGDITKIENYNTLMESIDIMRSIIVEYKEDTYPIDVVCSAVENLKSRKALFTKAYALNVEMPIVLYNTIALAIVSSVSFLISGSIEYIADPGAETFEIALNKVGYEKTARNLLFENLSAFNEACKKGEIDSAMEDVIRNNRRIGESGELNIDYEDSITDVSNVEPVVHPDVPEDAFEKDAINDDAADNSDDKDKADSAVEEGVADKIVDIGKAASKAAKNPTVRQAIDIATQSVKDHPGVATAGLIAGGVVLAGHALISIAKVIIPFLQNCIYYWYQGRQDVSDYFAIQAELVEMNAYKVQYNTDIDAAKRKNIYQRQMKISDKFKKLSNKLMIKNGKASKASQDMIKDEKKKMKTSDLGFDAPATGSALF